MVARSEQSDPASHAMRQRSAISVSAWDGPSRRAAHAQTGPGVRSERYIYVGASAALLRATAQRRQGPGSSDGRFVTLRVSHWMAVGIRRLRVRLSATKPCVCIAAKCVRLRRRGCDAFGRFVHSAWAWRVSPVAIRWLGSDLRSGQGARTPTAVLVLRRGARSTLHKCARPPQPLH